MDAPKQFSYMRDRSLALDSAGRPNIAYGRDHLYYARHDGAVWHLEMADSNWEVGMHAALDLDAAGQPHISYYDLSNGTLKPAYLDGAASRPSSPAAWLVESVAYMGGYCEAHSSIAVGAGGQPEIAYHTCTYCALMYATAVELYPVYLPVLVRNRQLGAGYWKRAERGRLRVGVAG